MGSRKADGTRIEQNRKSVRNIGLAYTESADRIEQDTTIDKAVGLRTSDELGTQPANNDRNVYSQGAVVEVSVAETDLNLSRNSDGEVFSPTPGHLVFSTIGNTGGSSAGGGLANTFAVTRGVTVGETPYATGDYSTVKEGLDVGQSVFHLISDTIEDTTWPNPTGLGFTIFFNGHKLMFEQDVVIGNFAFGGTANCEFYGPGELHYDRAGGNYFLNYQPFNTKNSKLIIKDLIIDNTNSTSLSPSLFSQSVPTTISDCTFLLADVTNAGLNLSGSTIESRYSLNNVVMSGGGTSCSLILSWGGQNISVDGLTIIGTWTENANPVFTTNLGGTNPSPSNTNGNKASVKNVKYNIDSFGHQGIYLGGKNYIDGIFINFDRCVSLTTQSTSIYTEYAKVTNSILGSGNFGVDGSINRPIRFCTFDNIQTSGSRGLFYDYVRNNGNIINNYLHLSQDEVSTWGFDNKFTNINCSSSELTIKGSGNTFRNSIFEGNVVVPNIHESGIVLDGCTIKGNLTLDGVEHTIIGCEVRGDVVFQTNSSGILMSTCRYNSLTDNGASNTVSASREL